MRLLLSFLCACLKGLALIVLLVSALLCSLVQVQPWQAQTVTYLLQQQGIAVQGLTRHGVGRWSMARLDHPQLQLTQALIEYRIRYRQGWSLQITQLQAQDLILVSDDTEQAAPVAEPDDWQWQQLQQLQQPEFWQQLALTLTEQLQQIPRIPVPPLTFSSHLRLDNLSVAGMSGIAVDSQLHWQPDAPGLVADLQLDWQDHSLQLELAAHRQQLWVNTQIQWQQAILGFQPESTERVNSHLQLGLQIAPYDWQWQLLLTHDNWPDHLPQLDVNARGQLDLSPLAEHQLTLSIAHQQQQWLATDLTISADQQQFSLVADRLPLFPLAMFLPGLDGHLDAQLQLQLDQDLQLSLSAQGAGLWQEWPWRLAADSHWQHSINIDQLWLQLGEQRLHLKGTIDPWLRDVDLQAELTKVDHQALFWLATDFLPPPLQQWQATGQLSLQGWLDRSQWQTSLDLLLDPRGPWPLTVRAEAEGDLHQANIRRLTIEHPQAVQANLSGQVNWQQSQFNAAGVMDLTNIDLLRPWLSPYVDLDWLYATELSARADVNSQGSFTDFSVSGDLAASAAPGGEPLRGEFNDVHWRFPDYAWQLGQGQLWGEDNLVKASGWFDLFADSNIEGNLALNNSEQVYRLLDHYLDLNLPWPDAVVWPQMDAELSVTDRLVHPHVDGTWQARGAIGDQVIKGQGPLRYRPLLLIFEQLQLTDLPGSVNGRVRLNFDENTHNIALTLVDLDHSWLVPLLADYPQWQQELMDSEQQLNGRVSSRGSWQAPVLDINLQSLLSWQQQPASLTLETKGTWPYLAWPMVRLDLFDLGFLQSIGSYQADDLQLLWQARLNLEPVLLLGQELGLFDWQGDLPFRGRWLSDLEISGPDDNRQLQGTQQLQLDLLNVGLAEPLPVRIRLDSDTRQQRWESLLDVNLGERGQWQLRHQSPNNRHDFLDNSEWHLQGASDLAAIYSLIGMDEQNFSGLLSTDLKLLGWTAPMLFGQLSLTDASYQNLRSGTKVDNLQLSLAAEQQRVRIVQGQARDSNQGMLILTGDASWQRWSDVNARLRLGVRDFHAVQRFDLDAFLHGDLDLRYQNGQGRLSGDLQLSPLTLRLNQLSGINIPTLRLQQDDQTARQNPWLDNILLNLTLQANRRAFIYGMGLEAELQGQVAITGQASQPRIQGEFNIIQGRYDLLTRVFRVEQGVIRLEQDQLYYSLRARHDRNDTEFRVTLEGQDDDVDIQLSSTPNMPEDELLAQLVFGRSLEGISTFQAVRLGLALNRLRTGSIDPIRATSDFFGIDTIDFDADEDDQITLMLGKYITDQLFLEIGSGTGEQSGFSGRLRLDMNPQWRFESYSTSGRTSSTGAELIWQRDF